MWKAAIAYAQWRNANPNQAALRENLKATAGNIKDAVFRGLRNRMKRRIFFVEPLIKADDPGFAFGEENPMRMVRMWCVCEGKEEAIDVCIMGENPGLDEKLYE